MEHIVVVKCGGSTVDELSPSFFESICKMKENGKHPVIVHGGGPAINGMLQALQIETEFVDGRRKTTPKVLETVEMVLSGKVNKQIVAQIQSVNEKAIGLSGVDAKLLTATAIERETLGLVGKIKAVNVSFLRELLEMGYIPVIAPIALDERGEKLNINADEAAGAIASALQAEELVFVTDVDGVLVDGQLQETLSVSEIDTYIEDGTIYGGMIPKVNAARESLTGDIKKVTIANGNGKNTDENGALIGTTIMKEEFIAQEDA